MNRFRTYIIPLIGIISIFSSVTGVYSDTSGSGTVTVTAIVPAQNAPPAIDPPSSGGGGGLGGVPMSTQAGTDVVVFKGLAYPGSIVTLLKNGVILNELPASGDGTFEIHVRDLNPGTYSFGVRAEDKDHLKSTLDLYTVYLSAGITTVVGGIFLPPTVTTDKIEVKKGDPIVLLGYSSPNADLTLSIHSPKEIVKKTIATVSGSWIFKVDSDELDMGTHEGKVRASTDTDLSLYSDPISFIVGTVNRTRPSGTSVPKTKLKSDLNNDGRVNLIDFSILAYWYKRTGFPLKVDLNGDNKINLTDFSILAYSWTG